MLREVRERVERCWREGPQRSERGSPEVREDGEMLEREGGERAVATLAHWVGDVKLGSWYTVTAALINAVAVAAMTADTDGGGTRQSCQC